MALFANAPRTVVIRAKRETILLVLSAASLTFALAYAIHSKPEVESRSVAETAAPQPDQGWTGHLASLAPETAAVPAGEPLSSASLVVPKSQLSLPTVAVVRPAVAKVRGCDETPCAAKTPLPVRPARGQASSGTTIVAKPAPKQSLMATLNPLNHLPDAKTLKQPFVFAGDKVSSWFRRL